MDYDIVIFLAAIFSFCHFIEAKGSDKKVFCYYSSSANGRPSVGKFWPEHIDPFLCTHVIFAFVDISKDGRDLKPNNWNDLGPEGLYARTIRLKEKNPELRVLLAVGGWKIGSKPFLPIIKNEATWTAWVKNAVKYLRKYGFDGMDMDWEFPGTRGSGDEDKYKFTKYMKALYDAFAEEAISTGRERMLLTLATASSEFYISKSYEPDKIHLYIDYMLLMTYNYHGSGWEKHTGHHSPLLPHSKDPDGEQKELHQQWSISYWLKSGVPKEKLIVGLPTYGLGYKLISSDHGIRAPADGGNTKGRYTEESGILSLYEICEKIQDDKWKVEWVDEQKVPYAHGDGEWVGFESPDSIAIKAKNIIMRELAGAFIWSVEMDDFSGHCGGTKYPLLRTVSNILKKGLDAGKLGAAASVDMKTEDYALDCNEVGVGIYRDPYSCGHFILCVPASHSTMRALRMVCPYGTLFDDRLKVCSEGELMEECDKLGIYQDADSCTSFKLCVSDKWGGFKSLRMKCPTGTKYDNELKVCNHEGLVDC